MFDDFDVVCHLLLLFDNVIVSNNLFVIIMISVDASYNLSPRCACSHDVDVNFCCCLFFDVVDVVRCISHLVVLAVVVRPNHHLVVAFFVFCFLCLFVLFFFLMMFSPHYACSGHAPQPLLVCCLLFGNVCLFVLSF